MRVMMREQRQAGSDQSSHDGTEKGDEVGPNQPPKKNYKCWHTVNKSNKNPGFKYLHDSIKLKPH